MKFSLIVRKIIAKVPFIKKLLLIFWFRVIKKFILSFRILTFLFYQKIDKNIDNKKLMINIGGGHFLKRHWRTLDVPYEVRNYWAGSIYYQHDLCSNTPWPFVDNSVFIFYSSHTFEHIHPKWLSYNLREAYRCLKPGGGFRITVPDYDLAAKAYEKKNLTFFHKDQYNLPNLNNYKADYDGENMLEYAFIRYFGYHMWGRLDVNEIKEMYNSLGRYKFADKLVWDQPVDLVGIKANIGAHVNWFNPEKLIKVLKEAGFTEVAVVKRHESRFKEITNDKVKSRSSGFDNSYPLISCYVEAYK